MAEAFFPPEEGGDVRLFRIHDDDNRLEMFDKDDVPGFPTAKQARLYLQQNAHVFQGMQVMVMRVLDLHRIETIEVKPQVQMHTKPKHELPKRKRRTKAEMAAARDHEDQGELFAED
jgi:hypothetical protein